MLILQLERCKVRRRKIIIGSLVTGVCLYAIVLVAVLTGLLPSCCCTGVDSDDADKSPSTSEAKAEPNNVQQSDVSGRIPFWSKPVVRDLVMTNSAGETTVVRQVILVSYDGVEGDELKPAMGEDGQMTVWVYRQGQRYKEAPTKFPGPDGLMTSVNGYLLFSPITMRLITFLLDSGTTMPGLASSASGHDT